MVACSPLGDGTCVLESDAYDETTAAFHWPSLLMRYEATAEPMRGKKIPAPFCCNSFRRCATGSAAFLELSLSNVFLYCCSVLLCLLAIGHLHVTTLRMHSQRAYTCLSVAWPISWFLRRDDVLRLSKTRQQKPACLARYGAFDRCCKGFAAFVSMTDVHQGT